MIADDPLLDRATIEHAFRRLGDRLARRGLVADLYVFGGAAMALAYDAVGRLTASWECGRCTRNTGGSIDRKTRSPPLMIAISEE